MTVVNQIDPDLHLDSGSHSDFDEGVCLLEAAQARIRFRADGRAAKGQAVAVRLWGQCELTPAGCWERQTAPNDDGYTVLRVGGKTVKAHRLAWELANDATLPTHLDACHTCDNPPCANPAHLFAGTHAQNNADRHAKGRTVLPTNGPDFWRAKTHCPQGHPYSGDNVRFRPDGRRRCAECYRLASRARRANLMGVSA